MVRSWSVTGSHTNDVAATSSLRSTTYGISTPVLPATPEMLAKGNVYSTSALPLEIREPLTLVTSSLTSAGSETPYELTDLAAAGIPLAALTGDPTNGMLISPFQAQPFADPFTGKTYVRARWYDPGTGTWLTPDPLSYRDSSNMYAFCAGDPVNCEDPAGLAKKKKKMDPATEVISSMVDGLIVQPANAVGPIIKETVNFATDWLQTATGNKKAAQRAVRKTTALSMAPGKAALKAANNWLLTVDAGMHPRRTANDLSELTPEQVQTIIAKSTGTTAVVVLPLAEPESPFIGSMTDYELQSARTTPTVPIRQFTITHENGIVEIRLTGASDTYIRGRKIGSDLYIDMVSVDGPLRRQGVSREMYKLLLNEIGEVDAISGTLDIDNLEILEEGIYDDGMSSKDALKRTPALRTARSLGFTEHTLNGNVIRSAKPKN